MEQIPHGVDENVAHVIRAQYLAEAISRHIDSHSPVRRHAVIDQLHLGQLPRYNAVSEQKYVYVWKRCPPQIRVASDCEEILVPMWELAIEVDASHNDLAAAARAAGEWFVAMETKTYGLLLETAEAEDCTLAVMEDEYYHRGYPLEAQYRVPLREWWPIAGDGTVMMPVRQEITVLPAGDGKFVVYEEIGMTLGGHLWQRAPRLRFLHAEDQWAGPA